jgi:hypothetical protein
MDEMRIDRSALLHDIYAFDTPEQTLYEAFQRTMLCDKQYLYYGTSVDKYLPLLTHWKQSLQWFSDRQENLTSSERSAIYKVLVQMDDITEKVELCCKGRRLLITQRGYVGLCPPYTMKGDLMHMVLGLDVALLLSRVTTRPLRVGDYFDPYKQYYLVGEG